MPRKVKSGLLADMRYVYENHDPKGDSPVQAKLRVMLDTDMPRFTTQLERLEKHSADRIERMKAANLAAKGKKPAALAVDENERELEDVLEELLAGYSNASGKVVQVGS